MNYCIITIIISLFLQRWAVGHVIFFLPVKETLCWVVSDSPQSSLVESSSKKFAVQNLWDSCLELKKQQHPIWYMHALQDTCECFLQKKLGQTMLTTLLFCNCLRKNLKCSISNFMRNHYLRMIVCILVRHKAY